MTQDNRDKMEEVITEILSAHYLPKTSGPAVASVVMQRLEYENLLGSKSADLTDPTTFKIGAYEWTAEELSECAVSKQMGAYHFTSPHGRRTEIHDGWFTDNIWAAMALMARIVLERKASGEIQ